MKQKNNPVLKAAGIFVLPAILYFNLSSCTKTVTTTVTTRDTTVIKDSITRAPSVLALLIGKDWQYDSLFIGSSGPGSGTVYYARGAAHNIWKYDSLLSTWTADGKIWTYDAGTIYLDLWSFSDSGYRSVRIVHSLTGTTSYSGILTLDNTHLTLYDSVDQVLAKYEARIQ